MHPLTFLTPSTFLHAPRSDQEALFPELFAQQLSKREAGARRAARDAHIAAERLKLQQGRQAATQALPPTS